MSDSNPPKSWIREIVLGVLVTIVAPVVVARLNADKPTSEERPQPQPRYEPPAQSRYEPPVSNALAPTILGKWEQFASLDGKEPWYAGGVYRVALQKGQLVMKVEENDDVASNFINTRGLSDVAFDGREWTFNSQLETGKLIHFKLRRTGDDVYEGHAYEDGVQSCVNRWTRVNQY